jgi:hypothetical protein
VGKPNAEGGSRTPFKVSLRSGRKPRVPGPQGVGMDADIGKRFRVEAEKGKAQLCPAGTTRACRRVAGSESLLSFWPRFFEYRREPRQRRSDWPGARGALQGDREAPPWTPKYGFDQKSACIAIAKTLPLKASTACVHLEKTSW